MCSVVSLAKPKSVSFSEALLSLVEYSRFSGCSVNDSERFKTMRSAGKVSLTFSVRQRYLYIPMSDVHVVEVFYGRANVVHYL